jgi:tripartite tricarboxylate transporter family receptor
MKRLVTYMTGCHRIASVFSVGISRRQILNLAVGAAAALSALPRPARAQSYPSRPVRIIVGFPAGGASDITARMLGQWLSERLGQQFIIENRPGAGTNIGTEAVAKSPPDGYTLLLVSVANTVNATLYERLNFDFIRDIAPVAALIRSTGTKVWARDTPAPKPIAGSSAQATIRCELPALVRRGRGSVGAAARRPSTQEVNSQMKMRDLLSIPRVIPRLRALARLAAFSVLVSSGTVLTAIGMGQVGVTGGALFYLISSTMGLGAHSSF